MESDDEFKGSDGKKDPEVFILNQHKVRSGLGHPIVIVGIPVKPGSHWMIASCGLVDNCSTGIIIHPKILKHTNYKIKQGEESEWKTVAGVLEQVNAYKLERQCFQVSWLANGFIFPKLSILCQTQLFWAKMSSWP